MQRGMASATQHERIARALWSRVDEISKVSRYGETYEWKGIRVTAVRTSGNEKTGRMAATYAPILPSCPASCRLKGDGSDGACYAQGGNVALAERRLRVDGHEKARPVDVATAEALAIMASFRRAVERDGAIPMLDGAPRVLRLHVSGDARTPAAARVLGALAFWWRSHGGGRVYTYTHAWRAVERAAWGPDVSVLASLDHPAQIGAARAQGYSLTAIVVATHEHDRAERTEHGPVIPCPAQTRGIECNACALCHRDGRPASISFAAHGMRTRALQRALVKRDGARVSLATF